MASGLKRRLTMRLTRGDATADFAVIGQCPRNAFRHVLSQPDEVSKLNVRGEWISDDEPAGTKRLDDTIGAFDQFFCRRQAGDDHQVAVGQRLPGRFGTPRRKTRGQARSVLPIDLLEVRADTVVRWI